MKLSLLTLAFAFLATIPQIGHAMDKNHSMDAMDSKKLAITAVAFHSDNCTACKILGPRMKEALNAINQDKIKVVKFDFTNDATTAKTMTMAKEQGVDDILSQHGKKTGWVALVNQEGQVVDKLNVDDDTAEIAAKLAKAIASAS